MSVGFATTKTELDNRAGDIARQFQRSFGDVVTLQEYLLATSEPDMVALGYTTDEVASLKTAFTDLMQLAQIWIGAEALSGTKDFRVFVRRLWGVGAF